MSGAPKRNMSGAPKRNKNATKGAIAKAALNKALAIRSGVEPQETTETFQALIDIWDKQICEALEGNGHAASMIIDRLDGKPGQSIEQTLKAEGISFNMSFVNTDTKLDETD